MYSSYQNSCTERIIRCERIHFAHFPTFPSPLPHKNACEKVGMGLVSIPFNGCVGNVWINLLSSTNSLLANFVSVGLDTDLQCKVVVPFIAVVFIGINSISTILDAWAEEHFVCWVKLFFLTSVLIRTTESTIYVARLSPDRFTTMED